MTGPVKTDALIILLHGVGHYGQNMLTMAEPWRKALPNAIFAAPDAPFAFERGPGRQWYRIADLTDESRLDRIAAARLDFDQVIRGEIAKHGFAARLDRIALVGFSQGSMMLIDAVVTGRWPVASAVAFAGRLTSNPPAVSEHRTRLLLLQGAADSLVPAAELDRATAVLKASGFAVDSRLFPNTGHRITPETAGVALEFLQDCLAAAAPSPTKAERHARALNGLPTNASRNDSDEEEQP